MKHGISRCLLTLFWISITSLLLSSCGITSSIASEISSDRAYLTVKVFQTLGEFEGLAHTEHGDLLKVVDNSDEMYDGKVIRGTFIRTGTYSYVSIVDDREFQRTVPVYEKTVRSYPAR